MTAATPAWDPAQYRRFEAERERAAMDLLQRVPADLALCEVWDLGCGPGRHTALLKHRHPGARVHGLDSSEAMLAQARSLDVGVDWRLGDIAGWRPERPVDLIFANASLQWLPDHARLFPGLADALAPGGVLAVQMPMAWESRHHAILRAVAAGGPWAGRLGGVHTITPLLAAEAYYDVLSPACGEIDLWSTTYLHALQGADPVLEGDGLATLSDGAGGRRRYAGGFSFRARRRAFGGVSRTSGRSHPAAVSASVPDGAEALSGARRRNRVTGRSRPSRACFMAR